MENQSTLGMLLIPQIFFFVMFSLQRAISGLQNAFGYSYVNKKAKNNSTDVKAQNDLKKMWITSMVLAFITLVTTALLTISEYKYVNSGVLNVISLISGFGSLVAVFALANCFSPLFKKDSFLSKIFDNDIHKWEVVITGGLMITGILSGVNLVYLFGSVLVGMVFHKGFINKAFNLPFLHKQEITNDLTGSTYNIPSLGLTIKRFIKNGKVRFALAIVLTALVLINEYYFKWSFDITSFVKK
jgi:hypothetical protein